jgi:uncharacterized membrane protein
MKNYSISVVIVGFCLLVLVVNIYGALGQSISYQHLTNIILYRDGLAHCRQQFDINTLVPEITVPLLSNSPQNILLLDENSTVVDYKVTGSNLTAYTLGASNLIVEYDTMQLTSKEAEVWTLFTQYPYNITVFLPANSTVVYLSEVPLAIETIDGAISMALTPGNWEISYILPASAHITPISTPSNSGQSDSGFKIEYIAIIGAIVVVLSVFVFILYKRKGGPKVSRILKENPQLGADDQEVIQFLIEKGGKAFEAELREKFPNMPRTSLWRLVRRLERLEIVEVKKIGLENQVQLKK